jgi:hypothetical protein
MKPWFPSLSLLGSIFDALIIYRYWHVFAMCKGVVCKVDNSQCKHKMMLFRGKMAGQNSRQLKAG